MLLGSQREGVLLEKEVAGREDLCPTKVGSLAGGSRHWQEEISIRREGEAE